MSQLTDLSCYVALDKGDGSYPVIFEICRCGLCPYKEITRAELWQRIVDLSQALVHARELFAEVYEKPREEAPPEASAPDLKIVSFDHTSTESTLQYLA